MKATLVLASLLLAPSLDACHQRATGGDAEFRETKAMDTRAQDIADVEALEARFAAAFKAKDVNAIMQLCVPDDSLVVFDVHPPLEVKGALAYRKDWEEFFSRFSGPLETGASDMGVEAGGGRSDPQHLGQCLVGHLGCEGTYPLGHVRRDLLERAYVQPRQCHRYPPCGTPCPTRIRHRPPSCAVSHSA